MTIYAPLARTAYQSPGVASKKDETIEEVRAGAADSALLSGPRPDASDAHPFELLSAPVPAPPLAVLVEGEEFRPRRIIYALVDPMEPGRVRYVGQTTRGPLQRYLGHLHDRGAARGEWVQGILARNLFPRMLLLEEVSADVDICDREFYWIGAFHDRGEADLNGPIPAAARRRLFPTTGGQLSEIRLEWDNGKLKLIAPRVVAGPPSAEAIELAQLLSRLPDPYADRSNPELVDAFVAGLLEGAA